MKKSIILIFLVVAISSSAQSLIDIYKNGPVNLVPDKSYGQNNDWNEVFRSYNDTLYGRPMGNRKSVILMPDGSAVVNHAYRNYYSMFDPQGKFVKEFGITGSSGKQFKKTTSIKGIMNNMFYTAPDNMGKMNCMDFAGNYTKTLTLNYSVRDVISLKNNKIAAVGWVIWDTKFRDFVAIVDFTTNEEKIIWDHFTDRCRDDKHCKLFNYSYEFEQGGAISFNTMPYARDLGLNSPPQIEYVNEHLVIALPGSGEILVYDLNGTLKSKEKIDWAQNFISVEEQKQIQQQAIDRYKNSENVKWISAEEAQKMKETLLTQMNDDLNKIKEPIPVPVFSTIIKDSDGNLLFFEIPKEEGANKFNVWIYQQNGKFTCQSSFICDDYDLSITPSKMVFHNGSIYALQVMKEQNGVPLRLVKFKLTN